ncbi:MAG: bifunctional glutamate N-acetyltransferase/amino-acid acetyltransferase ArgJ [Desulfobacterales bacterium]|nr:bifunctional glutamate N-acetyltransferase/amino-acid acetyltransferase ArgJ [Desulfobacterales bacterium]
MELKGYQVAGISAGIKKKDEKDLAVICSQVPAVAAGVFTTNKVQAAPVILSRERIKSGKCQAIIVNSGNANCCTGEKGIEDAKTVADLVASHLDVPKDMVLVASTGVIGEPLPVHKIWDAIPDLVYAITTNGFDDFAAAIMTTDHEPKITSRIGEFDGIPFTITGIAKGSGMIRPDMATMLCFVCTDVETTPEFLQSALSSSVDRSFHRINVDGDSSTNDMVIAMANGLSGATIQNRSHENMFQFLLDQVLIELAKMIVKDGEGATKFVEIVVKGAATREGARRMALTVANSNLVKTALFGQDANWGRIMAALGRAGVDCDPNKIDIYFNDVCMVRNGLGCGKDAERSVTRVLRMPEFIITIDLKFGNMNDSVFTCDLSMDYIRINADYRS